MYLFSFGWTFFCGTALGVSMMVRGRSIHGQSRWMWLSYMLMTIWTATTIVDPILPLT